ncbi:hypothetical protein AGR3A_Lc140340 [Agrobacterium tomkonis CFBP 6623]|uniref:Uncharacterized protein n=1 Tax=Agrobacterium tomkonis CFBP 6623 TaxID=1183432 RepID=A0A1S7RTH6_9HYPH|nr:hypothetical protein AGR3A_Lc140340 [Agrobacterium tomkonis CFBP 6623]
MISIRKTIVVIAVRAKIMNTQAGDAEELGDGVETAGQACHDHGCCRTGRGRHGKRRPGPQ